MARVISSRVSAESSRGALIGIPGNPSTGGRASETAPVAALTRLSRLHRNGRGIEDVTLELRAGEVLGLLGPRGSGRSTLLRVLATRLEPGSGGLALWGHADRAGRRALRRRIGYLPERDAHFDTLSGFHNAYYFGSLYGVPRERLLTRIDGLFDELELRVLRDLPVAGYDPDARRRLSLAETVLHEPALLLLDEPARSLGYTSEIGLRHLIARSLGRSAAVVLATSRVADAEALCSRVLLLDRGRVLAVGTREELLAGLAGCGQLVCELAAPIEPASFLALPGIESVAADHHTLALLARRPADAVQRVTAEVTRLGGRLLGLEVRAPGLGEVFFKLTGTRLLPEDGEGGS